MSSLNDWGSNLPKIQNPLKHLGFIRILRSVLILCLSGFMLMNVVGIVKTDMASGWITAIVGVALLALAIKGLWNGLYMTFRIPLGRTDPMSLGVNQADPSEERWHSGYPENVLAGMLNSRTNHTFTEPRTWLENLFFSVLKPIFFLAPPLKSLAEDLASAWIRTFISLLCAGLVMFLCTSGLIPTNGDLIFNVYLWYLSIGMLRIWLEVTGFHNKNISTGLSSKTMIISLASAFLAPALMTLLFTKINVAGNGFWKFFLDFNIGWYFLALTIVPLILSLPIFWMLWQRTKAYDVRTEVSEFRENWQQSIHPNELFIAIENQIMANRRYMEVPNRVYQKLEPKLREQTGGNKGSFSGTTIQETQPMSIDTDADIVFKSVRFAVSILGNIAWCALAIVFMLFATKISPELVAASTVTGKVVAITHYLLPVLCLYLYSRLLDCTIISLWSELKFSSLLLYFRVEGTFSASKISTGMSVYDSTRSENDLVRSSISPWIIISRLVTTTFITQGVRRFHTKRYVMEMHHDDPEMGQIVKELKDFMASRENIAGVGREQDLKTADEFMKINRNQYGAERLARSKSSEIVAGDDD